MAWMISLPSLVVIFFFAITLFMYIAEGFMESIREMRWKKTLSDVGCIAFLALLATGAGYVLACMSTTVAPKIWSSKAVETYEIKDLQTTFAVVGEGGTKKYGANIRTVPQYVYWGKNELGQYEQFILEDEGGCSDIWKIRVIETNVTQPLLIKLQMTSSVARTNFFWKHFTLDWHGSDRYRYEFRVPKTEVASR